MPLTNFPNGVTTQINSAQNASAGDGDLNCQDLYVDGVLYGEVVALSATFLVSSAVQALAVTVPFDGNLIGAFVTVGSVSAVAAGYTVRVGSAGSVAVATVSNTITDSYAGESLTTTTVAVTTANGIVCTRAVQGTAGDSALSLLLQRT